MTNTGKTLIIGLVLADLVVCGYLFYPREDRKSAPPAEAALTAPDTTDSRSYGESHVIAGSIARPGSPDASANASAKTNYGTIVSGGDVRASAPAAPMPTMPAATAAPATTLSNIPAAEMQPQAQLAQPAQPQTQTQVQPQPQPQRYSARSKATQHAEDARSHEDLRHHGSNDVGALMTELLVRESAKLDPSLPPPPASPSPPPSSVTDREPINRRNSNPVAAAMTDQLVKESARVTPASGAQRQPGTQ
ncbi:hypothetical protein [Paraburkholderia kirstenboschensis]|uniref:Extensin n=1 Tax=Paraburkholderia kirstenboschensis TaxID=1245436 RepID=A0ABZ0EJX9_9BURK|nr:hypothetical protein [Paraburkholderia kirstenboschensis]WOD16865.1 hypothetical protein RW095_13415 [Paraburkholderia kirstenboschensis]